MTTTDAIERVALYCGSCRAFLVTVAAPAPPVRVLCTSCKTGVK